MKYCVMFVVGLLGTAGLVAADFVVRDLDSSASENRRRIQAAVDETSRAGGGRVVIPPGVWLTGSIELKDGVELHLDRDATLKGSMDRNDYNANEAFPGNAWCDAEEWSGGHLLWGYCVNNVALTGEGTLDGNAPAFFGDCDEDSRWPAYKYGLKLHPLDREWFRPGIMVAFFQSKGVRIEGVRLANTTAWTCHLRCCDGVTVRGVTVDNDRTIANSDGFSVDCTRNVTIEKCVLKTGDDGFAIRASCEAHAATNVCENIVIRDCDVWSCCYGIRIGIGTGTIRRVRVENTRIHEAAWGGIGFTPAWVSQERNCYIEDILVKDCLLSECQRPTFDEVCGGDYRITRVRFENCEFRTLLPVLVHGSSRCDMAFDKCVRHPIERFKVRHRWQWNEREIFDKRRVFIEIEGSKDRVLVTNCSPRPLEETGVLLIGFRGRDFAEWERVRVLLNQSGAHATFFVSEAVDSEAIKMSKRLLESGHSVGLCGQKDIQTVCQQCAVAYVPVRSYALVEEKSPIVTDRLMDGRFDRVFRIDPGLGLDRATIPLAEATSRRTLSAVPVGMPVVTSAAFRGMLAQAGCQKGVVVLDVRDFASLVRILPMAQEAGLTLLGLDELPQCGAK